MQPFISGDQIAALGGIAPGELALQINLLPSRSVRITQSAPGLNWALQYNVSLTPFANEGPWRVDYHYQTGLTNVDESLAKIPELPEASPLPASATPTLFAAP